MARWRVGIAALAMIFVSLTPVSVAGAQRDWALTLYSGRLTDSNLTETATFDFEFENAYFLDLGLSRRLYTFKDYFDLEVEGQVAK